MKTLWAAAAAICLASTSSFAAGFALDLMSAKATGMGAAMTAAVDDASGVYFNPAGVVRAEGVNVMAGAHVIVGLSVQPTSGDKASIDSVPLLPPHAFASIRLADAVAFGFGFYVPYGNSVTWPKGWAGQELATHVLLETFSFSPALSFKLSNRLRIGVSVDVIRGVVEQERAVNFVDSTGNATLAGHAWTVGATAGLQFDILKELTAGVVYHGPATLPFEGNVHFAAAPPEFQTTLKDQTVKAPLDLPSQLQLGLAYKPIDGLLLAADAWYTDWTSLKSLDVTFQDSALNSSDAKKWNAVWSFRVGGEYAVSDKFAVRAGFKIDPTPSPHETLSPNLPDANRTHITVGAGYEIIDNLRVDAAYQLTLLAPYDSTYPPFPGSYSGTAHTIGLTLGYHVKAL